MNNQTYTGVLPLVCAVCTHVVGIINADAYTAMAENDEVYICNKCMQRDEQYIEFALSTQQPYTWRTWTQHTIAVPTYLPVRQEDSHA